jgi:hypothetical protein
MPPNMQISSDADGVKETILSGGRDTSLLVAKSSLFIIVPLLILTKTQKPSSG